MKILLLGKNGQVGWELQRALAPLGEVVALDFDSPGQLKADFSDPESLAATVRAVAPQIIVNSAAHTAVDKCESEPERAHALNAASPAVLAREAKSLGAWLLHYSTDYVFNGSGNTAWSEDSQTDPLNVYGATKLEGENAIRTSGCQHLILRTSWVYAARGGNFAKTMLKLAQEREKLTVINDQIGAPTGADLLADISAHMLRIASAQPEIAGIYHTVASGHTSWHEYASLVIEFARNKGLAIRVPSSGIEPVPSSAFVTPAERPKNSRMTTTKFSNTFNLTLPPWQQGVERMLNEILSANPN
jgi:dTDP-4-dehydrorhamnose reductase